MKLKNAKCDIVLTPHIKEFSRLIDTPCAEILEKGLLAGEEFSAKTGATLLLKNAVSIVYGKSGIFVNATGNSGQAKGGSGDLLSGLLAGILAQGANGEQSAVCAAYILGKTAEIVAKDKGEYALIASDIIDDINIPKSE